MSIYLVLSALSIASGVWGHPAPHHPAPRQVPVSNQYIHVTDNFDKCLAASSDANGATTTRQSWTVSGSTLQVFSNMCLDVTNGAIANGTPLQIWECAASNTNQEWTLSGSTIQWSGEDSCLDLTTGMSRTAMSYPWAEPNDGPLTTGASETITHWTSNTTCLTAPTNANGGEVVVAPCDGSASQLWTEIGPTIVVYGNMCLDVPNGNTTDGVKLQIWACTPGLGDANQQFFYLTSDQNIQWINEH
ncbi:ricin B lectin domain-containing protein, partial [Mycena vulgaris]